jgi:hypothetical protein
VVNKLQSNYPLTLSKGAMMNTLYLLVKFDEKNKQRYIGYTILNGCAVKLLEASIMEDIDAYMVNRGFIKKMWRVPKEQKYQMIRVKEW